LGPAGQQDGNDGAVALLGGLVQRRVAHVGLGGRIGAVLQQEAHHVRLPEVAGHVERRICSLKRNILYNTNVLSGSLT